MDIVGTSVRPPDQAAQATSKPAVANPVFQGMVSKTANNDSFVRTVQTVSAPQFSGTYGGKGIGILPEDMNLASLLYMLGNDKDGAASYKDKLGRTRSLEGVRVARLFTPDEKPVSLTYNQLYKDMMKMAKGYEKAGLKPGAKAAIAETNSLDFFSSYFGSLAVHATAAPLNLLALNDEKTKTRILGHMLGTPQVHGNDPGEQAGADAFVYGADPLFEKMSGVETVTEIKRREGKYKLLGPVIERYIYGKGAKRIQDKVLDRLLGEKVAHKLENTLVSAGERLELANDVLKARHPQTFRDIPKEETLEQRLERLDEAGRSEFETRLEALLEAKKSDFRTMMDSLPARMKVVSPRKKLKLMRKRPLEEAFHPTHLPTGAEPEKVADILYTSGTSGDPKGVALTHRNLTFSVNSLTDATKGVLGEGDVVLLGLPLFHIFGKAVMLTAFAKQLELSKNAGNDREKRNERLDMVLLPSLTQAIKNLDRVVDTIAEEKVTVLPAVPTFLKALMAYVEARPEEKKKLASLKTIISGGEALDQETFDRLRALNPDLKILEGYGSSEGGINLLNKSGVRGYVGHPLPGVEVKVNKEDPGDDRGELLVRSPGVANRYVKGTVPEEKAAIVDEDGWYHTGDVVSYDPEHGYKIVGRESFFLKRGGERRPPEEFEQAIRRAVPSANDAMVVPFHIGEGTANEKAVAVVVSEDPAVTEESVKESMAALRSEGLPRWTIPDHILVLRQPAMPARFDNGFKRDAGYKLIKKFVQELLNTGAIELKGVTDRAEPGTKITNQAAFDQVLAQYNV